MNRESIGINALLKLTAAGKINWYRGSPKGLLNPLAKASYRCDLGEGFCVYVANGEEFKFTVSVLGDIFFDGPLCATEQLFIEVERQLENKLQRFEVVVDRMLEA